MQHIDHTIRVIGSMSILQTHLLSPALSQNSSASFLRPGSGAWDVSALPLPWCRCRNVGDVDWDLVHTQRLEQVLGLAVDLEGCLGCCQSGNVGNVSVCKHKVVPAIIENMWTHWSFLSRSSSCSRKEIPRTGPFWIRFIKWVVTEVSQDFDKQKSTMTRQHSQPEILFLNLLEGTDATSSRRRLLVLEVSMAKCTTRDRARKR
jgi:hypothetical protein